jgi:hypothetical protein
LVNNNQEQIFFISESLYFTVLRLAGAAVGHSNEADRESGCGCPPLILML